MKILFEKSFEKEIDKLRSEELQKKIIDVINQVEIAKSVIEIKNMKKMKGYKNFYRIKINDYRIGVELENNTVIFAAFGHRKEIYRKFPA